MTQNLASTERASTRPDSTRRASQAFALSVGAGLVAVILGLVIGGGAAAVELADPGAVVRYGQPIAKMVMNFSMAVAIGSLIFAAFSLQQNSRLLGKALDLASVGAIFWALSGAANFLLTYLNISGSAISFENTFGQSLWLFATSIELGTALAINVAVAVALSVLALALRSLTASALLAALGVAGLVPLALIGHAAGSANHSMAVNSLLIHLVAIVVWVGGLVALFVVRGESDAEAAVFTKRYSSLALAAFGLVAVSGVSSAVIRITRFEDIFSAYGLLVFLKIGALVLLGILGVIYRLRLVKKLSGGGSSATAIAAKKFFGLVAVEFVIMGTAIGLATALSRTPTPISAEVAVEITPAQILTGEPLPPELTPLSYLTVWKFDLLWAIICAVAIGAYILGVRRLAKRGDTWPVIRTISWVSGMLLLFYVTSGALNAYSEYLFSVHMIGHMILAMGIPVLLVPGAPVTLLMRAVEKRQDDSRGVREWVLWAVHTKYAHFVSHPLVAAVLFASSLVTFYYTPLFSWATSEHLGHLWMVVHFLIVGYLFTQALIGIDPGPAKLPFAARVILLIGTMAFHAFFGLSLMSNKGLLLADWFGAMGRTWGESPLEDQVTGGAIAWGIGEFPVAVLIIIVAIQWFKSDTREAKRLDRQSDRTGNKDVEDYNQMLAKLSEQDAKDVRGSR